MNASSPLFVTCAPALETLLSDELDELGVKHLRHGYGGVYIDKWDLPLVYTINYASRLASRVLLPLARFRCFDQRALYRGASQIDWGYYLRKGMTLAIDAHVNHPKLRHSLFCAQVVKDAICDRLRREADWRPSIDLDHPTVRLHLAVQSDEASLSLDTSGASLHKRGYRQAAGEAPLQETMAAALLRLARYRGETPFYDPCCGSGTILIEAALIKARIPPGFLRHQWGFMYHPAYRAEEWLRVRHACDAKRQPLPADQFFGLDIHSHAVAACQLNLRAAGLQQVIQVTKGDFRPALVVQHPRFVMTNPPHGKRLENVDSLRPLYRALGDFLKKQCAKPARAYIFTGDLSLSKEIGLAAKRRYVLRNGGVEARLLEFDLY